MYEVEFQVMSRELGPVRFILHCQHQVTTIRGVLDQLFPRSDPYALTLMSTGRGQDLPISVIKDENKTLEQCEIEDGSVLFALPQQRAKFP